MRRGLLIVSVGALVVGGAALLAQALLFTWGVVYDTRGQPTNPTPAALAATWVAGVGVPLSFLLCAGVFAYGVVAMTAGRAWRWLVALVVAGGLALAGMFGVIWVLLSANSPIALAAPSLLVPLLTAAYALCPAASSSFPA
ncbi:MAG: hypothetical protein KGO05_06650 [Chloroflexota bacterium]|nr:hypothetical protein [Chloroflexota bacterium]